MDRSHVVVQSTFSFMEAYHIFKVLGLRHLPVVNFKFSVVGILTRHDFLQFPFNTSRSILYNEEDQEDEDNDLESYYKFLQQNRTHHQISIRSTKQEDDTNMN